MKSSKAKSTSKTKPVKKSRWSQHVTETSNAMDLERGVFAQENPHAIAASLQRSAESSSRKKVDGFRSAMSMLNFYINRAGKSLPKERLKKLEAAKDELRSIYGRKEPRT